MLRQADLKKPGVNRKLIAWVFMGTAAVSLAMWWMNRSEVGVDKPFWEGWFEPVRVSYEVKKEPESQRAKERENKEAVTRERLLGELREMVATASGSYAVYVYRLDEEVGYGINEREVMPGASILKVPAMVAALKKVDSGEWTMDSEFELKEADRSPGSGPLQYMAAGTKLSLERILTELGKQSDNTAWLMVNRLVGVKGIEEVMLEWGMTDSSYRLLSTTAVDIGKMWAKLYEMELWEEARKYLVGSIFEERIPAGIDDGEVEIVHKVGTLPGVWADAGIVKCKKGRGEECKIRPFVVVILNEGVKQEEAEKMVPEAAKRIWEYERNRVK